VVSAAARFLFASILITLRARRLNVSFVLCLKTTDTLPGAEPYSVPARRASQETRASLCRDAFYTYVTVICLSTYYKMYQSEGPGYGDEACSILADHQSETNHDSVSARAFGR
jgi:hypothetical protein